MRLAPWALALALTGCTLDSSADPAGAGPPDGSKVDGTGAALATTAKTFAEAFDFEADSPTEVARDRAATSGPTWVRRAFALHHTWENNDLGSARLYHWTVADRRVWALRTSTDGDDSFVELFDGTGGWLATGLGGFAPDPATGGFRPTVTWDAELGAVRDRIAPRDMSPDVAAFWTQVAAAVATSGPGGATIGASEARGLIAVLLAGPLTTASIDGWEQAAVRRALADRTIVWTASARAFAQTTVGFYEHHFGTLGTLSKPAITTLGLHAALASHVRLARGTLATSFDQPGQDALVALTLSLGLLPASALPTTASKLTAALVAAGASTSEAAAAVHALGADAAGARIFSGALFTASGPSGASVAAPGTAWFVASPTSTLVSALQLIPAG